MTLVWRTRRSTVLSMPTERPTGVATKSRDERLDAVVSRVRAAMTSAWRDHQAPALGKAATQGTLRRLSPERTFGQNTLSLGVRLAEQDWGRRRSPASTRRLCWEFPWTTGERGIYSRRLLRRLLCGLLDGRLRRLGGLRPSRGPLLLDDALTLPMTCDGSGTRHHVRLLARRPSNAKNRRVTPITMPLCRYLADLHRCDTY